MITMKCVMNTETWKAKRGYWDGSKKEDGSSGGRIVIRTVKKENSITIRNISIPLKTCTAMAAEIAVSMCWLRCQICCSRQNLFGKTSMNASIELCKITGPKILHLKVTEVIC